MEKLICDSIEILRENEENMDIMYDWMDIGDIISEKQRDGQNLDKVELDIVEKLCAILRKIRITDDIVLYRGVTKNFNSNFKANQFSSLSSNLNTAKTYGNFIMKVIVPKDSHGFYVSAWEAINKNVPKQEETEILLLPGEFILLSSGGTSEGEHISTFLYKEK